MNNAEKTINENSVGNRNVKRSVRKRNRVRRTKKGWLWEFSKRLILTLTILYCLERIFAMVMIAIHGMDNIDTFLTTGSEVFLASVVAYAVKAGFENVCKIKNLEE